MKTLLTSGCINQRGAGQCHKASLRKSIIHVVIFILICRLSRFWVSWEKRGQFYFACQSKVRSDDKRGHTKYVVRLPRESNNQGKEEPEIILLNSHDGSSGYQMIFAIFCLGCTNGLVCRRFIWWFFMRNRKGDVVGLVIEGIYYFWQRGRMYWCH